MANNSFVSSSLQNPEDTNYNPASDYEHLPIQTLETAVENISDLVPDIIGYASTAKERCNRDSTLLTWDESAAIYLYTMPTLCYSSLSTALRAVNRQALTPWLAFLKLLITALEKLPPIKATIWRGVNYDATSNFVDNGAVYTWWGITSCVPNINAVQPYLGDSGTLLGIETTHGKDISMFSAVSDEQEVILMPGTRVRTKSQPLNFIDRLFIIILEEINPQG